MPEFFEEVPLTLVIDETNVPLKDICRGILLLTYIILAAGAVSTEVVYLAYKGDTAITWSQACGSYGGFCKKATASVAITFVVGICYALLSLISFYRLFSKYDAPVAYNNKGIETASFTT